MSFDLSLLIVAGASQLAMTLWGTWLALRPPNPKYHWLIVAVFAVLGLLGLGAVVWEGFRTASDQQNVSNKITNIEGGVQRIEKIVKPPATPPSPPAPVITKAPKFPRLSKPRIKPLTAYTRTDLLLKPTPQGTLFQGFNLTIMNESDETLTGKITHERILVDELVVIGHGCEKSLEILDLKGGVVAGCKPTNGDFLIPPNAKKIVVEWSVEYDTVPPTSMRHSYREMTYDLNWSNGPDKLPMIAAQYTQAREN